MTNRKAELMNKLRLSMIINFTLTVMFMVLLGLYISDHNSNLRIQSDLENENEYLVNKVASIGQEKDEYYRGVRDDNIYLSTHGAILCYMVDILSEQNRLLSEVSQEQREELEKLNSRVELFDKYEYAILNELGDRTDITYDQIVYLEDLCENEIVDDPDLFLAWIMTESKGVEKATNANSTAKGYGQFLNSTSKWVYEDLYGEGKWKESVALDGNTNLNMMVYYVNYLYAKQDCNLYKAIDSYRGAHSEAYVAKINSYLSKTGKSLDSISSDLQKTATD